LRELQTLTATLAEFSPLLNALRGNGHARSFVQVAGAAKEMRRRGRNERAS